MQVTVKRFSASWILALALILAGVAVPAQAQGDLAITVSSSGYFADRISTPAAPRGCSAFSPQFVNEIQNPAFQWPFTSNHPAPTIPSECIQTKVIWVENKGIVPTLGPVTVNDSMTPDQPKGSTVLTTNGYCAFEALGSTSGTIWCLGDTRVFGAPTNKVAANGWNCTVTQGKVSCTRSDTLAPGATYPPITIRLIREDFSPLICFNDFATVSGGGFTDIDPSNNSQFDDYISWSPSGPPVTAGTQNVMVVNSVPNGRVVRVDGQSFVTPHFFYNWTTNSIHTIEGEETPQADPVCQAPIPGTGKAFPGNAGYTVVGYSAGSGVRIGTSGVGCQNPTSFILPEFQAFRVNGSLPPFFYNFITVRYKQP